MNQKDNQHHVVIIGGGFGGMHAAMKLRKAPVRITLLDKRNFHLFQPLLYQVATGGLSPGDIAYPIRSAVGRVPNVTVLAAEVMDISPDQKKIHFADGDLSYDSLIVATGVVNHYFGHDDWSEHAPGLKTVETRSTSGAGYSSPLKMPNGKAIPASGAPTSTSSWQEAGRQGSNYPEPFPCWPIRP